MVTQPAVSVIMNCYNASKDLREALDSVKKQTFQDFEIIFWDNGSTDSSADIARAYGQRLKYFRGEKTVPLGEARNLAIAKAKGKYVAFLDCDDIWAPTKLQKLVALMEANPKVGLVCSDTEIFDGKHVLSRVFERSSPARGQAFEELMQKQWITMSSAMARREALDSLASGAGASDWFDENLQVCEEADVFYRLAHDWDLDYVDEPLVSWRVHSASSTFKKFGQFGRETLYILDKYRKLYPEFDARYGSSAEILTRRAAFQRSVALWREGKNGEARKTIEPYLGKSVKYRLFWLATFLPGSLFDICGRLYFALPAKFRK